jgi:hypothetical protein
MTEKAKHCKPFNEELFIQIMKLSLKLGWTDIALYGHLYEDEFLFYFSDGKMDSLYFQVNINPLICCMVYDIPHGIYTGWHIVNEEQHLADTEDILVKLAPIFSKNIFESAQERKKLRSSHPKIFGYAWAKGGGLIDSEGKHVWPGVDQ